jgi:hypothetical protein
LRIRFRAIPGLTYQLQQSATMAPADWHDLPAHRLTATSTAAEFLPAIVSGERKMFYRVMEQ